MTPAPTIEEHAYYHISLAKTRIALLEGLKENERNSNYWAEHDHQRAIIGKMLDRLAAHHSKDEPIKKKSWWQR